jgi:hypothetical protein
MRSVLRGRWLSLSMRSKYARRVGALRSRMRCVISRTADFI